MDGVLGKEIGYRGASASVKCKERVGLNGQVLKLVWHDQLKVVIKKKFFFKGTAVVN